MIKRITRILSAFTSTLGLTITLTLALTVTLTLALILFTTCVSSFAQGNVNTNKTIVSSNKVVAFLKADMAQLDNVLKLNSGFVLNYQVLEDKQPPTQLTITDSGDLIVPYYTGTIKASGKTCRELAQDVKKALEATHYKHATVLIGVSTIKTEEEGVIMVTGSVRTPGLQNLPSDKNYTVTMAIIKAGGATDFARLRKVRLTRTMPDGELRSFFIDVDKIQQDGRMDLDMDVQAGDMIFVPRSFIK